MHQYICESPALHSPTHEQDPKILVYLGQKLLQNPQNASHLCVLILILVASHSAENPLCVSWRSLLGEANRTRSSEKSGDVIWRIWHHLLLAPLKKVFFYKAKISLINHSL